MTQASPGSGDLLRVETRRLILSPLMPEDASETARLVDAALSRNFATWPAAMTAAEAAERIAEAVTAFQARQAADLAIRRKTDGRLVGWIGLSRCEAASDVGLLGYWIGARFAGSGLMSEAIGPAIRVCAHHLGVRRIEARVYPHNPASIHILGKAGFHAAGRQMTYSSIRNAEEESLRYVLMLD